MPAGDFSAMTPATRTLPASMSSARPYPSSMRALSLDTESKNQSDWGDAPVVVRRGDGGVIPPIL